MPISRFNEALSEQREKIKSKRHELSRIKEELRTAEGQAEIDEGQRRKKRAQQEIFRLQSEIRAAKNGLPPSARGPLRSYSAESEPATGALPDFLIIETMKGGTTFLYNLLTRHPLVEPAASKELRYFTDLIEEEGIEWYRYCFAEPKWKDGRRTITGEATPSYLFHPLAPERAAHVVPQGRLIALLRNPVDRAYSHYQQMVRKGREPLTFEEAIELEEARLRGGRDWLLEDERYASFDHEHYSYLSRGLYANQLLRWSGFFGDEQLLVLKSEDLYERRPDTLKRVLKFLELPEWEPEDWEKVPTKRNEGKSYDRGMDPVTRRRLEGFFEPHNLRLYEHLGIDLGW